MSSALHRPSSTARTTNYYSHPEERMHSHYSYYPQCCPGTVSGSRAIIEKILGLHSRN